MSNGNDRDNFPSDNEPGHEGASDNTMLDSGAPSVAASPKRLLVVVALAVLFIGIVVHSLFFSGEKTEEKPTKPQKGTVTQNAPGSEANDILNQNALPQPPKEPVAAPPQPVVQNAAPPPPPPVLQPPTPTVNANTAQHDEQLKTRIKSAMIVSGGGSSAGKVTKDKARSSTNVGSDPNSAFAESVARSDGADRVEATDIGNQNVILAQGKLIDGVLESAISTDLPGPIRAIVTHDTYAEAGRDILIPKGSRLIGLYNPSVRRGQGRVFIIWTRMIRPDGVDIALNSPGIDSLGRAGIAGDVDNRYFEVFSTALLTSALDIGVAAAGDGLFGNQQQTTTTSGGGTTSTSSPSATAMQESVQNIGDVGKTIVSSVLNLAPIITVDQGTMIKIFINHDLVFPTALGAHSRFVE